MQYKYLLEILIFFGILGCVPSYAFQQEDITKTYSSYVNVWQKEAQEAFDKAEPQVFKINPKPDEILGPNPDASKCVCKGSGIIIHGDKHTTPCPYHHKGGISIKAPSSVKK